MSLRKVVCLFFPLLAFASAASGQNLTIQTLVGGGVPQNIQAAKASLGFVSGVAVDGGGNVYMTLQSYSAVVKMDATGLLTLVAGNGTPGFSGDNGPAASAQLSGPWGIALDKSGNLYIADSGNNRIRKVSNGVITTIAGGGTPQLSNPIGVAVDSSGNVYIGDTSNHVVRKVSGGVVTTVAGTGSGGFNGYSGAATSVQLSSPAGVAVDASGNLFIADYGNDLIRQVTNGALTTLVQVTQPISIAFDTAGNQFIASWGADFVGELPVSGNGVIVAGNQTTGYSGDGGPATSAMLNSPAAVAVDASNNLYIADYNNHVVRKVANGVINTLAGGPQGFVGDNGPATSALLFNPTYAATGNNGEIYIVDSDHNRVRKVANGVITTVAGNGSAGYSGDNGPAASAQLDSPWGVAVDKTTGDLYISDSGNSVIRRVSGGVITTVAGTGTGGFSGDNGAATSAQLSGPSGIAVSAAGSFYFADFGNNRIRQVAGGVITTVAGNGTGTYGGDGGAPTSAALFGPVDVKVDAAGNLYIADQGNNRIRKVAGGVINTLAGNGTAAYGGDNGSAASAQLHGPSGISLDAAGNLLIADTSNNVIRKVASDVITTIAGTSAAGYSGDHGPPTSAALNGPLGVGVGPSGEIYIADSGNNLVRAMNLACNFTLTTSSLQATATGGSFPIGVQTASFCTWTVSGLPAWITVQGGSSSFTGPVTLTLVIAGASAARSATISIAGNPVVVNQAACAYTLSPGGQVFPAAGGSGTVTVTTASVCAWTVTNSIPWITLSGTLGGTGSGSFSFLVAADAGGRSGTFTVAGVPFTVEEQAASIPGMTLIGSMPHIAAEENWTTTFTLVNTTAAADQVRLNLFAANSGSALALPLDFPQQPSSPGSLQAASLDRTLSSNASLVIKTSERRDAAVQTGAAQVNADGALNGFAIFHQLATAQEAVVPLETRNASSYLLAFDNTNGIVLGVALANLSLAAADVAVVIRDDTGAQIANGPAIALNGSAQTSFVLSSQFPVTANKRGTIEFDTPTGGRISVLGIRFTPPNNALTTIPALANVGTSGGSFAHLASGGDGWQTTFALVNVGNSAAPATLSFFDDQGNPLPLPYSLPQVGSAVLTAASVTQTLQAGATLLVQSTGAVNLLTGSAQLSTKGNVSGFVIFRHNGQEAVVPLESRNASAYILAFDNTGGTATGVALNSVSAQAVDVPVVLRDDAGVQIGTDTIHLAANGHWAHTPGVDVFLGTANIRGTIEFDTPSGGQIGALGIRIPPAHTFTTLPALVR